VTVTGRNRSYRLTADEAPRALGSCSATRPTQAAGRSGESAFVPADCSFARDGAMLRCRR
jgi:hypothetical protein